MNHDLYAGIAKRYDLFKDKFGAHKFAYINFFRKLFKQYKVHTVLDCACGTGHQLVLFHRLGCKVVGSDISSSILAQAKKNFKSRGIKIPLRRIDYRTLPAHFDCKYDAVACLSSSILHMQTKKQALRALGSMRGVLKPGGTLVMTQGTTDSGG